MTRLYIISRLARQNYWINVDAQYSYRTYVILAIQNSQFNTEHLLLKGMKIHRNLFSTLQENKIINDTAGL